MAGAGITMATSNGSRYCCHHILATFIGNYPEQALVTCTLYGHCPKCLVPPDQLGTFTQYPNCDHVIAYDLFFLNSGDQKIFHAHCWMAGFWPVIHPFWKNLPYSNSFLSITPDILYQLSQGVLKHIIS
jgi:hypothetical protein